MGSGHFLVRATEYLAEEIFKHPTTKLKTEKVVKGGATRSDIKKSKLIPVSPGLKQDDAEIAYWRRRVVESCIYGVDLNPMAVELAKLSLVAHLHRYGRALEFPRSPSHAWQHAALCGAAKLDRAPTASKEATNYSICGTHLVKNSPSDPDGHPHREPTQYRTRPHQGFGEKRGAAHKTVWIRC